MEGDSTIYNQGLQPYFVNHVVEHRSERPTCPVTQSESDPAKNETAFATSSGTETLPNVVIDKARASI